MTRARSEVLNPAVIATEKGNSEPACDEESCEGALERKIETA